MIQRFVGALNLNLHVHALVVDGVFARDCAGVLNFHPTRGLTALDVEEVLATVEPRITRLLYLGGQLKTGNLWTGKTGNFRRGRDQ